MEWIKGSQLCGPDRMHVLCAYVHRFTGDHKPQWAHNNPICKVQFKDDKDWLENTKFAVTSKGLLDLRVKRCESTPIWER